MANFEREFSDAVEGMERSVLIELIRSRPEMSLAAVAKLSKGRFAGLFSSVTVGELIAGTAHKGKGKGARVKRGGAAVDTRTPVARKRYDQTVLDAVANAAAPISAQQVRAQVGGTPLQARKALNRLIEAGRLSFQGKARATRYAVG